MSKVQHMAANAQQNIRIALYDRYLAIAVSGLLAIGLLMVYSTSVAMSERTFGQPFYYAIRHAIYLLLGLAVAGFAMRIELDKWKEYSGRLLLLSLVLLVLVLIPGLGREVNGSMRWLGFRFVGFQVYELAKIATIIFLASYLVRRDQEIKKSLIGFLKPMLIVGIVCALILKEPDFGAATVIMLTMLGVMFLAGVPVWQFIVLLGSAGVAMVILAISSPYRMLRLTTFLNPWANPFDSGYQLTQSLIAFGRGGWFGVGLGESIQKLFYLPEAHTDFIFAVLAEELGLLGMLVVAGLFALLVARAFIIGRKAALQGRFFSAYLAYGIGFWIAIQTMINMGVNMGMLPTKGLTLPLMSSGGSSLLVTCFAMGILLRIDYESRLVARGLRRLKNSRIVSVK